MIILVFNVFIVLLAALFATLGAPMPIVISIFVGMLAGNVLGYLLFGEK